VVGKVAAGLVSHCPCIKDFIDLTTYGSRHMKWRHTRVLTTLENLEISGNLLILENSGSLKFTHGIYQMLVFFVTKSEPHKKIT